VKASDYIDRLVEGELPECSEPPPPLPEEYKVAQIAQGAIQAGPSKTTDAEGSEYYPAIKSGDWYANNGCVTLSWLSIEAETAKAILLRIITDPLEGEVDDLWLPKKLLSNMHLGQCTVGVWDKFLLNEHPAIYYNYKELEE
jgi:hypothetical protein